jgi:hypothetical protein
MTSMVLLTRFSSRRTTTSVHPVPVVAICTCLDPPVKDEGELTEPWFCFICVAKRPTTTEQPEKPARGLFAPLLNSLNKKNPQTFALPESIRDYFEGVSTAKTGEFVEAVKPKTR